jgi:pimeloyl-ACP methyl ester carboxylesterase
MTKFGIRKRKLSKEERNVYKKMFDTRAKRRTITHLLHELVIQEELLSNIKKSLEVTFNKLPVLIIYGDKDPLTEFGIPHEIHRILPNSELHWIKGEAHFPHEGAPEEMNSIITNWLKGIILSTIYIVGM